MMRRPKNVVDIRQKQKRSILKAIAGTLAALMIACVVAYGGLAAYEYNQLHSATLMPGTCIIDGENSGAIIMEVTGLKEGNYVVKGLVLFMLPFDKEIPYHELNTQIKEGLLKRCPEESSQ